MLVEYISIATLSGSTTLISMHSPPTQHSSAAHHNLQPLCFPIERVEEQALLDWPSGLLHVYGGSIVDGIRIALFTLDA